MSALLANELHVTMLPKELTADAATRGMQIIKSALPGRRYGISLPGVRS